MSVETKLLEGGLYWPGKMLIFFRVHVLPNNVLDMAYVQARSTPCQYSLELPLVTNHGRFSNPDSTADYADVGNGTQSPRLSS